MIEMNYGEKQKRTRLQESLEKNKDLLIEIKEKHSKDVKQRKEKKQEQTRKRQGLDSVPQVWQRAVGFGTTSKRRPLRQQIRKYVRIGVSIWSILSQVKSSEYGWRI